MTPERKPACSESRKGRKCGMQVDKMARKAAMRVAMVGRKAVMVRSEEPLAAELGMDAFRRRDCGRVTRRNTVAAIAKKRKEKAEVTATFLAKLRCRWRTMMMGRPMMKASEMISKAPTTSQKAI